eukprot:COSAG05_NODE_76_length_21413_cov_40.065122_4_plen_175_part_00
MQCFNSSAKIRAFMRTQGWDPECPPSNEVTEKEKQPAIDSQASKGHCVGYKHLTAYFIRKVHALARKHGRTPCGWQEIFDHYGGTTSATPTPPFHGLDPTAVIYDWLAPGWGWANPGTITQRGWRAVSTLGLYLSSDQDNTDWMKYQLLLLLLTPQEMTVGHSARLILPHDALT